MRLSRVVRVVGLALGCALGWAAAGQAWGQSGCGVAPVVAADSQPNIFSEQQEGWLGRVESDVAESELRPVRDAALSAHLQAIADRLVATLPATTIKFRVTLVDSDEINGFSIAGGHIYIMRKLAAVAQSDDELAGVIGHEIGHIVSHQFAFETTREMKRLLNVTSVGDEADIRKRWTEMLDAEYRDKHPELSETDSEQAEADRIGLYAMAAAGYRAKAYAEFWNRVFFVQGKTGSKLGDLLGITKPSQKRLRSIGAMVAAIPADCGKGLKPDDGTFAAWNKAVIANQKGEEKVRTEALSERTLTPPLRMELDQLKFSPNGKLILGQDESSIFLLERETLALRYRIDAVGAMPANFSPDSEKITFSTPGLHVEEWSTREKKLLAAREMVARKECYDTRLSPDGRTLICVEFDVENAKLGLTMLDTTSSEVLWEKKGWMEPNYYLGRNLLVSKAMNSSSPFFLSSYSADGNVLLFAGGAEKVAFDLKQRAVMKIGGGLKDSISGGYAFVGSDKVAGINFSDYSESGVYSFPEGQRLKKVAMPFTGIKPVSNPGSSLHVLVDGSKDYAIGLDDLGAAKFLVRLKTMALDEYDGAVVGEALGGAVVTSSLSNFDPKQQKHVDLPISPLPFFPPAALSKDGRFLALSERRRGGVWDLSTGKQIAIVHGFTDAMWTDADSLYMDVPKDVDVERHITEFSKKAGAVKDMPYKVTDETHMRFGRLTDWKQDSKKKLWMLSMYNPATDSVEWSRSFTDRYFSYTASYGGRDLIFDFGIDSHTAKDELKANAALASEAQGIKDKKTARLIKVVDGKTGEDDGELVVALPPNFAGTDGLNRAGDLLYVGGVDDRTAVYSMKTGKQERDLIGYVMALDAETGRVFTANRVGEGVVYDAAGTELAHYDLGDPIRFAVFRAEGTVVTILTADQKVRAMRVGAAEGKAGIEVGER